MKIFCNGQIVPEEEAKISASDHGFLYGASLFETFRTYHGEPFLLSEHMQRMAAGCRAYEIDATQSRFFSDPPSYATLRETIRLLLLENKLDDAVFRLTVSAGEMPPGLPSAPYARPTELIFVRPIRPLAGEAKLHVLRTVRTEPETSPRPKSAQYMNSIIGYRELTALRADAGDEGLMLTRDGRLAEGISSNVFLCQREELFTPGPSAHILPGITRKKVLELATGQRVTATEADLGLCDLTEAKGIFLTNSVRGVSPVSEVKDPGGRTIWRGNSSNHPLVRKLIAAYQSLTG